MVFSLSSVATFWLGIAVVCGYLCWKFILQPIANQGQPIEPPETQDEPESKNTSFDIFEDLPDTSGRQNDLALSF